MTTTITKATILQLLQLMVNIAGGIPKCCVKTSMDIPTNLLRRGEQRYNDGLILHVHRLHVKGKKLCAHPKIKRKLKRLQRKGQKRELVNVRQLDFSVMYFYTLYLFIMKCSGGVF
uniref:Chemokine interleukin-8-like domain-containing protein n=1 Tax=Oncorhynchus mykiss TaxID=8022 RepID=A0A8C7QW01_ONCMY